MSNEVQKLTPQKTIHGLTFYPIPEVSDIELAFGAKANRYFDREVATSMVIPYKYEKWASDLIFDGGSVEELPVDTAKATRALSALISSFAPPHESKEATVAYALWVWDSPEVWGHEVEETGASIIWEVPETLKGLKG